MFVYFGLGDEMIQLLQIKKKKVKYIDVKIILQLTVEKQACHGHR